MEDQLDPLQKVEIALLRAEYQIRFQGTINYLKEMVGEGIEYRNTVVRVVVSERGAYYELNDLPEEFFGAVSEDLVRRFVAPAEAIDLLTRAVEAGNRVTPENTRHLSILVLYTRRGVVDRKNCYLFDYAPHESNQMAPRIIGKFQPDVMPLFFKIKIDADFAEEVLGARGGIVFCMANAGDRHLLMQVLPTEGQITDLGALPLSETLH
jgi:hypothetical protein